MGNYVQTATQRNIPSNMDLIQLHTRLNDELEKFHQVLLKTKEISITQPHHLKDEQQTIFQTIEGINKHIQSKAMAKKLETLLH